MDPYKSISLPLGAAGMRVVHATLRRADGSMRRLSLSLERSGTIEALLSEAADQVGLPRGRLVACEVFEHKVYSRPHLGRT